MGLRQKLAAFALIVDRDLLAQLQAHFRLVPGGHHDAAVLRGRDGQGLVGNGFELLVANSRTVVGIVHTQMITAIVARRIVIHGDACAMPAFVFAGIRRPRAYSEEKGQDNRFSHRSHLAIEWLDPVPGDWLGSAASQSLKSSRRSLVNSVAARNGTKRMRQS